jgi:D-glycero-D-manno-heptose 1,7-bisphosphate phosphatase
MDWGKFYKMSNKKKAVFLDRDGVINHGIIREGKSFPPSSLEEFSYTDGIKELLNILKEKEYILIICTNQPDVRTRKQTLEVVESFHNKILHDLPIDDIYTCYHTDEDKCDCRKPLPGLLKMSLKKWDIDFNNSFMIGDRWKDIDAGKDLGCKTIFIDYGLDEKKSLNSDFVFNSLIEILENTELFN